MTPTISRVVLLYGGTWEERAVSISTAIPVDAALRGAGLDIARVRWDQTGWTLVPNEGSLEDPGRTERPLILLEKLIADGVGIVFNALHGGAGEDGSLSAIMEIAGVPFSGASVLPSAISQHKGTFRVVAEALGLEVEVIPFPLFSLDFLPVLTKAAEFNPDAISSLVFFVLWFSNLLLLKIFELFFVITFEKQFKFNFFLKYLFSFMSILFFVFLLEYFLLLYKI